MSFINYISCYYLYVSLGLSVSRSLCTSVPLSFLVSAMSLMHFRTLRLCCVLQSFGIVTAAFNGAIVLGESPPLGPRMFACVCVCACVSAARAFW